MKTFPILACCAALLMAAPRPSAAQASPAFAWPHGARAAVSLAYDDALDSHLDKALPALERAGLKASFYLQLSNPAVARRMDEWRHAARRGHELGNHTLFHQCSASLPDRAWVPAHRDLDKMSVEQVRDQALLADTMLRAIDGRGERTFAAPCGDLLAGGRPYLPAITAQFVAIKAGAATGPVPSMRGLDPYAVPVHAPAGMSGRQLIALVEQAGARGTMVNLTFHGIGGDYLQVSEEAHRELLDYLAAHRERYWTDTFLNIMKHVKAQQRLSTPAN